MTIKVGYLLPTRERVMADVHETGPILAWAEKCETEGLDSVWLGDSLTAKPRHEPLTLLSAIAARTTRVEMGTAVLLPMLRNPVIMAQQVATLDQISEGRVILGIGIGNDSPPNRAEFKAANVPFEKRVGTMLEGLRLCKALWTGEPIDWDGRWQMENAVVGPKPFTPGGPPIWGGGGVDAALKRAGRYWDGWMPSGPEDSAVYAKGWEAIAGHARDAGRDPGTLVGSVYLTLAVGPDAAETNQRINTYLETYYNQPAKKLRSYQGTFAGTQDAALDWLRGFAVGGATHFVLRLVGDHDENIELAAAMRAELNS
jgi:alkanesulfonate monooxygenase SsuD/methylene tetrahydromethanopterin reductase-like flavin-dependent oxidoreductase (luciferase family)